MDQQLDALERMTKAALARKSENPDFRTANEVIVEDQSLRPFSARLTAKDIVRLKALSRAEGMSPSDLLRRILAEGMDRMEAKHRSKVDPERASVVVGQIIDLLERSGVADPLHLHSGT